jgi:glucose/arabinose dehydrogenase
MLAAAVAAAPPPASVRVNINVPPSMRTDVFVENRTLMVPPGFAISVVARVPGARFLAIAPNRDIFVSQPGAGKVLIVRQRPGGDPLIFEYATGLRLPHDIVFDTIGGFIYVYIAESNRIIRSYYVYGDTAIRAPQVVVANLPDASTPELNGPHAHALKNIALDRNHKLYVSSASTCNACVADINSSPMRAAVYQYNADGTGEHLFARGLRNAEGLAILPGTDQLWVVVNGRDEIRYPRTDSTGNFGQLLRSYVEDHPPEIFTSVRDGGNYGWPFCNPTQDGPTGWNDMLLEPDSEVNPTGTRSCTEMDRPTRGIQAHSAPLGLSFLHNSRFPAAYRFGAVVGLHGSWNRSRPTGYKVIYFPWNASAQRPEEPIDLVSGWLDNVTQHVWGRPVDAVPDDEGGLIISDDSSGTLYRLSATPDPCRFSVSAGGISVEAAGGGGSLALTATTAGCSWTVGSSASWIQLYPLIGNTSGKIDYNIYPNFSSTPRTAILQIAGQAVSVTQEGSEASSDERLIERLYFNYLGRQASPEEIAFHVASLSADVPRAAVAFNFMNTGEFNLGGRLVAGLYVGMLGRDAEYNGWLFQRNAIATGQANPVSLTSNFLNSAEFSSKFGQLTEEQFAGLLYRNILLREPTNAEITLQARALRGGTTRSTLAHSFLSSAEFRNGTGPRLTAFLLYATLLGRDPSPAERTAAIARITGGTAVLNLIQELMQSLEFAALQN